VNLKQIKKQQIPQTKMRKRKEEKILKNEKLYKTNQTKHFQSGSFHVQCSVHTFENKIEKKNNKI